MKRKWVGRGYTEFGGVWSEGESKKEVINKLVEFKDDLSGIDLFSVPKNTEIEVLKNGTIRFRELQDESKLNEEILEEGDEKLEGINERIRRKKD